MTDGDYHFDLLCPWTYHARKWIREASSQREINVAKARYWQTIQTPVS
jgi:hypothetical protein